MSQNELQRVVAEMHAELERCGTIVEVHSDDFTKWIAAIESAQAVAPGGGGVAPWPDFAGNPIHDRDRIRHPADGATGTVVFLPALGDGGEAWRVVYDGGEVSRLSLQVGDKGQAVVLAAAPASEAVVRCSLYRVLPYGTNGWRYAVVRGNAFYGPAGTGVMRIDPAAFFKPAASSAVGESEPHEFGIGIEDNPKARYWQNRAAFWRETAKALGYVPPGDEQEQAEEFPELPEPEILSIIGNDGYTADQMHDYARAALLRRAARVEVEEELQATRDDRETYAIQRDAAEAKLALAEQDARRYRWLRDWAAGSLSVRRLDVLNPECCQFTWMTGKQLDQAIAAAIAAGEGES